MTTTNLYLKGEWAERLAVLSKVWVLSETHIAELERYFLLRSDNEMLIDQIECTDTGDYLKIGVTLYKVEYMNCSWNMLDCCWNMLDYGSVSQSKNPLLVELVLSCRLLSARNFAVVIVQPRYEHMTDEAYYMIRELDT